MRYFNVLKTNENHPRGASPNQPEFVQIALAKIKWRLIHHRGHAINLRVGVQAMTKQKRKPECNKRDGPPVSRSYFLFFFS